MAEIKIVQALESFSVDLDGAPFSVQAGDSFLASDPVVKGREGLFGEVSLRSSGAPRRATAVATETATAAPGERRTPSRAVRKGGDDA
jgi:hypothetical protein